MAFGGGVQPLYGLLLLFRMKWDGFPVKSLIYEPVYWKLTLGEQGQKQGDQTEECHNGPGGEMVA